MIKKIFCAALMMTAIIFVGNTKVFAQDVWVCNSGGIDYYIMTETFNNRSQSSLQVDFSIKVKYVRGSSLIATKTYSFKGHDYVSYSIDGVAQEESAWHQEPTISILNYAKRYLGVTDGMSGP